MYKYIFGSYNRFLYIAAYMAFSFITFFHVLLVPFFIIVYMIVYAVCFCLILKIMYFYCYVYVFLLVRMFCSVYSVFISSATLTDVFPCFFLSCRTNVRV